MVDLVERVRNSCARVMETAAVVEIEHQRVLDYHVPEPSPSSDTPSSLDDEAGSLLILALDAINFGSGYHDVIRKAPGRSGAVSMAAHLTTYATESEPLTTDWLRTIEPTDAGRIFDQRPDGGPSDELMALFATALNDLGQFLHEGYEGSALVFIEAAGGSAVAMAQSLAAMPYYQDVGQHRGLEVAFYKRAQITAADLARGGHRFTDLHRLTAFADNLVPHVLRCDGLLRYQPELLEQINAGRRLEPGSLAEIEIRAAAVHVVELLAAKSGHRPMDLDLALWQRGSADSYKAAPRHRTRSVFY